MVDEETSKETQNINSKLQTRKKGQKGDTVRQVSHFVFTSMDSSMPPKYHRHFSRGTRRMWEQDKEERIRVSEIVYHVPTVLLAIIHDYAQSSLQDRRAALIYIAKRLIPNIAFRKDSYEHNFGFDPVLHKHLKKKRPQSFSAAVAVLLERALV